MRWEQVQPICPRRQPSQPCKPRRSPLCSKSIRHRIPTRCFTKTTRIRLKCWAWARSPRREMAIPFACPSTTTSARSTPIIPPIRRSKLFAVDRIAVTDTNPFTDLITLEVDRDSGTMTLRNTSGVGLTGLESYSITSTSAHSIRRSGKQWPATTTARATDRSTTHRGP